MGDAHVLLRHWGDSHQGLGLEVGAATSEAGMLEVPGKALWGKTKSRAQIKEVLQRWWPKYPKLLLGTLKQAQTWSRGARSPLEVPCVCHSQWHGM